MKLFMTAIALTIASSALAQSAPANPAGHSGHAPSANTQSSSNSHEGHEMGGMMMGHQDMKAHCELMKAEGKTMMGCDMMQGSSEPAANPHAGHGTKPQ